MSHRDTVVAPPAGARVVADSEHTPVAAFEDDARKAVRRPVPPRGRPHAARPGGAEELPLRDRRRCAHVDAGGRDRGAGRADPRPGRARARALRALRRRRLARSPRCSCTRRSATSSRASSSTTACCARTRPSRWSRRSTALFHVPLVHVQAQDRFLDRLDGCHRARGEAQAHRRGVHPRLRGRGAQARRRSAGSCRGRSTRT